MSGPGRAGEAFDALDLATETLGIDVDVADAVRWAFDAIDVAEDVLSARYGSKDAEPAGAFAVLCPRVEIFRGREPLLRAHYREILDRADAGEDLRPGTAAEMLAALSEVSRAAPIHNRAFKLYVGLFADVFGRERAIEVAGEEAVRRAEMDWETDSLLRDQRDELSAKLSDPDRTLARGGSRG